MDDPRPGIILLIIVLSLILRINCGLLIWTKRKNIPLIPSIILALISPVFCLIMVSYITGRSYETDMRSPIKGSVVLFGSFLISQFITGLLFVGGLYLLNLPFPSGRGIGPGSDASTFEASHILALVAISSLLTFISFLFLKPEKEPVSYFKGKKILWYSLISIIVMLPLMILTSIISVIIKNQGWGEPPSLVGGIDGTADIVYMGLAIVILAPFIEELLFRGYIFDQLSIKYDPLYVIPATAILFALVHFSIATLLPIFLMGLFLGFIRKRSDSILPSIIFHAGNNLIALIVMLM